MAKEAFNEFEITSSLPHESGKAADPEVTGISYKEAKVGSVGGGTIHAVYEEAMANAHYAAGIITGMRDDGENPAVGVTLDSPDPLPNFKPVKPFPFNTLDYQVPTYADGTAMQWWDMVEAYKKDEQFMEQHFAHFMKPGKHLDLAHHNVGVALQTEYLTKAERENRIAAMRYHSQLLITTKNLNPDYFKATYGSYDPTDKGLYRESTGYLHNLQMKAIAASDVNFLSTETERLATIAAVVAEELMTEEEAKRKFITVPIPVDTSKFRPDDEKESIRTAQIEAFNKLAPDGLHLDHNKRYIGFVGRRDHEKNTWDAVKAYGYFLIENAHMLDQLPDMLGVGGPTNKPGVAEKEADMWQFITNLPAEIQAKFHIASTPLPHETISHLLDLDLSPSFEETYNINEKQARLSKKIVAISDWAAGHKGTHLQDTGVWFHPLPLDEDSGNWRSFLPAFEAGMQIANYNNLKRAGLDHLITPDMQRYADIQQNGFEHAVQNFSQEGVLKNTFYALKERFPTFFDKDKNRRVY